MINSRALAGSAGLVAAITFAVCGALVAFAPGAVSLAFGWIMHIDVSTMVRPITLTSYVGGLVLFSAFVWLGVGLVSRLYNRFSAE